MTAPELLSLTFWGWGYHSAYATLKICKSYLAARHHPALEDTRLLRWQSFDTRGRAHTWCGWRGSSGASACTMENRVLLVTGSRKRIPDSRKLEAFEFTCYDWFECGLGKRGKQIDLLIDFFFTVHQRTTFLTDGAPTAVSGEVKEGSVLSPVMFQMCLFKLILNWLLFKH